MSQLYRVRLDGTDIYNPDSRDMTLLSPELTLETGSAGSLAFLLPPEHVFYDAPALLTSTVEVLEEDTPIWSGRPSEISVDILNRKRVYCEGALAYLNDSVQGAAEYNSIGIHAFFTNLITAHNAAVPASRRFTVGDITVTDRNVYRKLSYEGTFDAVRSMCLDTAGGWLSVRRENGVNYIDWLRGYVSGDQPVQYGYNLLELDRQRTGGDIVTQVLPLGDNDDNGSPITVASVNGGSNIVADSGAVALYGPVTRTIQFSGVRTPAALLTAAQQWLEQRQTDTLSIQADAADLHYLNANYGPLGVGQLVRVRSAPHGLDRELPITKMGIRLDSARKNVTLGTLPQQTLTEIIKQDKQSASIGSYTQGGGYSGGGSSGGGSGGGGGGSGGDGWTHWVGTAEQYQALSPNYSNTTVYFVLTGDENAQV